MNELQKKGYEIALKKSKIHQNNLVHLITEKLIKNNIDLNFINKFDNFVNIYVQVVVHGRFTIKQILEQPRLKSYFELRPLCNDSRFNAESKMFHKIYDNATIDRPKYGSLNITLNKNYNPRCISYGNKVLFLKDEIKNRTSFMYGDSFGGQMYLCTYKFPIVLLYHLIDNEIKTIENAINNFLENNKLNDNIINELSKFQYIEAQIHGEVTLENDVEKISILRSEYNAEIEDIVNFMDRYPNIKINVYDN
jgi:hypothetical protein